MNLKKLWDKNKAQIIPVLDLAKTCLEDIIDMRKHPNAIDYVNLALSFKENLDDAYNLKDTYRYFNNPKWKLIASDQIGSVICNLIQSSMTTRLIPVATEARAAAFVSEIEGVKFGWIILEDESDNVYVEKIAEDRYTKVLEKIFWEQHPFRHVVLGMQGNEEKNSLYLKDDEKGTNFVVTPLAKIYADDIQDYLKQNISRSILYYGPTGSGKSNLIKNICFQLQLKTIRINSISQLSTEIISEIIKIFNPDAIILEDIDHVPTHDVSQLLDKIENFNKKHKLCFATANKISKLDDAIIRPERFDQTVRIFQLEHEIVKNLVFGDLEIYEKVRDWPAASITELMKRIKVKGKAHALDNMQDLLDRIQKRMSQMINFYYFGACRIEAE